MSIALAAGCSGGPAPSQPPDVLAQLPMYQGTDADYDEALAACDRVLAAYEPFGEAVEDGDVSVKRLNPLLTKLEEATPNKVLTLEAINGPYYNVFAGIGGVDSGLRFGRPDPEAITKLQERASIFRQSCVDVAAVKKLRK